MRPILAVLVIVALAAPVSANAEPPAWGVATALPGYTPGSSALNVYPDVGLAGNGDAVVGFPDNSSTTNARLFTRIAGTWASVPLPGGGGARSVQVAMDDRGDIAVAYEIGGQDDVYLAYKPSGGPWQLPATFTEKDVLTGTAPSVAINERGDAVASWEQQPFTSTVKLHTSVYTRPASGTGSWGAVETVDGTNPKISGISSSTVPSAPAAIDNAGNAIIAYSDVYGTYTSDSIAHDLYAIRSARRSAGGSWSGPQDVTGRPQDDPQDTTTAPRFFAPLLAADPRSGDVVAGWFGRMGSHSGAQYGMDDPLIVAGGSVTGGVGTGAGSGQPVYGQAIAAAPGTRVIGGLVQTQVDGGGFPYGLAKVSLTQGGEPGTTAGVGSLPGDPFQVYIRALGLGAGSGGFAVAGSGHQLWVAPAAGAFGAPVDVWPAGDVATPGVAGNCRGDGFAAVYSSSQKLVYIDDYPSGVTDVCGDAPVNPVPSPTPGPSGSPSPMPSPAPSASATPPPVRDTTPPTLALPSSDTSVRVSPSGSASFRVGPASEAVSGTITLTAAKAVVAAKHKTVTLGRATFTLAKGATKTVKVKLSKAARKALRRHAKLKVRVVIVARDATGNATTKRLTTKLKRPKK